MLNSEKAETHGLLERVLFEMKKDVFMQIEEVDTMDPYKKVFEELKRKNLMDWGVLELAESVLGRQTRKN